MTFNTNTTYILKLAIFQIFFICSAFSSDIFAQDQKDIVNGQSQFSNLKFKETSHKDIQLEKVNRRKWGNPVIADLDQDGYPDLLLTDHGFSIKLYWNNNGVFSKGYDLIMGDTHGIGVGDYDKDGKMDILISRGGGSGTNARNTKIFHVSESRDIIEGEGFSTPLKMLRGRTNKLFDADGDGDLDMIVMGFPFGKQIETQNFIYKNDGKGELIYNGDFPKTNWNGQKILITDYNDDHKKDIFLYGDNDYLKVFKADEQLNYTQVTEQILPAKYKDVTGVAEIDYDNDGDFDLFLIRGKELKNGETFFNKNTGDLFFTHKRGEFYLKDFMLRESDFLELYNYQSAYPHQNIYVGESAYLYDYPEEYHKGQDFKIVNSNALGFPDTIAQKGFYLGYIGNNYWRLAGNSNPQISAIIKNVKSYPYFEQEEGVADILLENNKGIFTEVTKDVGFSDRYHSSGLAIGDYDNNGYQDLFIVKRGDPTKPSRPKLYLNSGDKTFTEYNTHNIVSQELGSVGMGAEAMDYNLDGRLDIIYGNDRGQWHLFKNINISTPIANYVILNIGPSNTGCSPLGAIITTQSCGHKQRIKIGASSAPYSQSLNNSVHLGLANCTSIDKVSVTYSNGEKIEKYNLSINTLHEF